MKVFLIILAVLFVIFAVILSLSAEFTIVFENGWSTKLRILFIEKDIELFVSSDADVPHLRLRRGICRSRQGIRRCGRRGDDRTHDHPRPFHERRTI